MTQEKKPNRLAEERSPYLLQHAYNPIDWYPWGDEAFEAAKEQNKPIFLSIGYASCHWCHVMERESFRSDALARQMNDTFINIKVDREELPQVDSIYMEFAQLMLGGIGGWPLNLVLTPQLRPVFAATYLPPDGYGGQLGLRQLVERIAEIWDDEERELLLTQAEEIFESFQQLPEISGDDLPNEDLLRQIVELYYRLADPANGGMQGAPKFPMSYQLDLLLRHASLHSEGRSLFFVQTSLEMMHRGGIYDHMGGGFARYAVDTHWVIPHFEKMLYDNAILASSYAEAWSMTKMPLYRAVAEDILRYALRDLSEPNGGFISAEDAESDGKEGYFYTWTRDELVEILGVAEGNLFCEFYGVTPEGNFEGRNVLYIPQTIEEFAEARSMGPMEVAERLSVSRQLVMDRRDQRNRPAKDDKVIVAWNGLMIGALAKAGRLFSAPRYISAAQMAANFIKERLWIDGRLHRRWRAQEAAFAGCIEDYAYLISGLLDLFKADGDTAWLSWAMELANVLTSSFKSEEGSFFRTDIVEENLILRQTELYDGAEPSGNAVHAENLLRLYALTGAERYRAEAEGIIRVARTFLEQHPLGGAYHCLAIQRYLNHNAPLVVIALNETEELKEPIAKALAQRYLPHSEVVWRKEGDERLYKLIPGTKSQIPVDGQTTLYVCRDGVCEEPLTDPKEIIDALAQL